MGNSKKNMIFAYIIAYIAVYAYGECKIKVIWRDCVRPAWLVNSMALKIKSGHLQTNYFDFQTILYQM